jgi:DNA-binding XRE family transcriptional regulator
MIFLVKLRVAASSVVTLIVRERHLPHIFPPIAGRQILPHQRHSSHYRGNFLEPTVAVAFGEVLKALRKETKMTQEQLGLEASVQRKHISQLELGTKAPSLATALRIAKALNIEPGRMVSLVAAKIDEM